MSSAVRVRVGGRVQGVGFRYHVLRAARRHGAVGWVRNLPDGDVELWAEGSDEGLEALVDDVRRGPQFSRVDRCDVERQPAGGEFASFDVRY
jgi:acylphosphatase